MLGFIIQEFFILYIATTHRLKTLPVMVLSLVVLILNLFISGVYANFMVGVLTGAILFILVRLN